MKTRYAFTSSLLLLIGSAGLVIAAPIGTAFTYQGKLTDGSQPAQGIYDLRFTIYDSASGGNAVAGPETNSAVAVSNGVFTVALEFGGTVFSGNEVWLEIAARTNGAGAFATFPTRQALTATPYALYAANAGAAATGAVSASSLNTTAAPTPGQVLTYNGSQLVWTSLSSTGAAWNVTGNSGTAPVANFLGTTDNQPLEFKVYGRRALRLEPTTNAAPNLVGGSPINYVGPGVVGATIGGGGAMAYNGGVFSNAVKGDFSVVGGGGDNIIQTNAAFATIAGGGRNSIGPGADDATIGGGWNNSIQTYASDASIGGGTWNRVDANQGTVSGGEANVVEAGADHASIGGGYGNYAHENASYAAVAGGGHNEVQTNAAFGAIGGGSLNTVQTGAQYATVPGGLDNTAGGKYSFAAGHHAKALNNGAFVWADSTDADFASTSSNQFLIRAGGGVGIGVTNPAATLDVAGTVKATSLAVGTSSVVTNLNAELLNGLRATNFWQLCGNSQTTPGLNFIGTTDNQPLEFKVNGQRALRLEPNTNGAPNIIGGAAGNWVAPGIVGSVITGGGVATNRFGNEHTNRVAADFCFLGGGWDNSIQTDAWGSFLGGGSQNIVGEKYGSIGGGWGNSASAPYATVPGGAGNLAGGPYSFAAGHRAKVYGSGTFLWCDSVDHDLEVIPNNQFVVRASGGVNFWTAVNANGEPTVGVFMMTGDTDWRAWCDRNLKQNFKPVDDRAVLEKIAQLPVTEWNLVSQDPSFRHIGPVAQDFHAAFGLGGPDDKSINNTDAHGVLFAAVKGLNEKLEETAKQKDAKIQALEERLERLRQEKDGRITELERRLATLEQLVLAQPREGNGGGL